MSYFKEGMTEEDLKNLGVVLDFALFTAKTEPNLLLTSNLQTVSGWVPFVPYIGFTEENGMIIVEKSGIYDVSIERTYSNGETNPSEPVKLYIEVWINGMQSFDREAIISSATANDEPAILSVTSPSAIMLQAGDTIEFKVRASGDLSSNTCRLNVMQLKASKIREI